jgi:hypothetical protein
MRVEQEIPNNLARRSSLKRPFKVRVVSPGLGRPL